MIPLRRGRIVWVEVTDPRGANPKCRPVVLLTRDSEIMPGAILQGAAVTTFIDPALADISVKLPWERNGHPKTGLNQPNVAVCDWIVTFTADKIEETAGVVPGKYLIQIDRILARIDSEKKTDLSTPADPTPPQA
jgi:mRNA interferase MazF